MKQLRYLNLSRVGFHGEIPHVLGNLTNLEVLDLGGHIYYASADLLYSNDVTWVSSLVALRYLDLTGVNLTRTSDVLIQVLGELHSLSHLALAGCGLGTSSLSRGGGVFNSTPLFANLQYLDLSVNGIEDAVPSALRNMTALKYLDLSGNNLARTRDGVLQVLGVFPSLSHLSLRSCGLDGSQMLFHGGRLFNSTLLAKLQYLDLSFNYFNSSVPSWLRNMTAALTYLDLSVNYFNSSVPIWFDRFESLVHLDLSRNDFTKIEGGFSHFIRGNCNLRYLNLGHINVEGQVEIDGNNYSSSSTTTTTSFFCGGGASFKLETLLARKTQFKGNDIFDSLGRLQNLRTLDLGRNSFSAPITNHISNKTLDANTVGKLTNLVELDLSGNGLEGEISQLLFANMLQLRYIDISNNQLQGAIPHLLFAKMLQLKYLDISNNQLQGPISQLHFASLSRLRYLDISNNKLSIDLQQPASWVPPFQLHDIRMGSCNFQAQFPWWIQTQVEARLLDLSNANISGDISNIFGTSIKFPELSLLDISHNQLSGTIMLDFKEKLPRLEILILNDNHLSGSIPTSLCYLESKQELDLSTNHLSGIIPDCWGQESNGLLLMDLSSNKLFENIPFSLTLLTELRWLNLSHNFLSGNIPENIGDMEYLELFDLSNNHLSGSIPSSISNLVSLSYFNLSNNNLQGRVPTSGHFDTFDDSVYAGNPILCGVQVSRKCPSDHEEPVPSPREEQEENHNDVFEKLMSYMAVILGFATGFWGVIFTLVLNKTWRIAYFNFVEDAMGRVYVDVKVKANKIKRRMRGA